MPLVSTKKMFQAAYKNGFAVGAFNVNNMELLQGLIWAAKDRQAPLILQISKGARQYANMKYLRGLIEVAMTEVPDLPVAVHLDHGDEETALRCIDEGFTSVMIDASHEPYEGNVRITKKVADYAHAHDPYVTVEAELGQLGGVEEHVVGVDPARLEEVFTKYLADYMAGRRQNIPDDVVALFKSHLTDPDQAADFVQKTGCDSLAVACGTSHGAYKFKHKPILALPLFDRVAEKLPGFPLVMHGSSSVPREFIEAINRFAVADTTNPGLLKKLAEMGLQWEQMPQSMGVPEEAIAEAAKRSVCKVNIDTDLRLALTSSILSVWGACNQKFFAWLQAGAQGSRPKLDFDPRKYLGPGREAVMKTVAHKMDVLGCAGKAAIIGR